MKIFKIIFIPTLLLFSFIFTASGYGLTKEEGQKLAAVLSTQAKQINTATEFYQAGQACYTKQLNQIVYFSRADSVFFWSHDDNGNCVLSSLYLNQLPPHIKAGSECIISHTLYQEFSNPWYLDAIKSNDASQQVNPVFRKLLDMVYACLSRKQVSATAVITLLKTSPIKLNKFS